VERIKRFVVLLLLCASAFALFVGRFSAASVDRRSSAEQGARWLAAHQRPDGSLSDYAGSGTGDLVMALLAGGVAGAEVDRALGYVRTHAGDARKPGQAARIVMGLVAAGENPRAFGGVDYVARTKARYDATTGAYEDGLYADALAALGVLAANENLPGRAVTYLRANQCVGGGYAWKEGCAATPDVDTTSAVMSALLASGLPPSDSTISRARTFVRSAQNPDGGFPLEDGKTTNANSTGLALSAIAALGENATGWRTSTGGDPISALSKLQGSDGGFRYQSSDPSAGGYATVQAVLGLAGVAYPMAPVKRERASAAGAAPVATSAGSVPAKGAVSTSAAPVATGGSGAHRAGVVVREANGDVRKMCVRFDEPSMTGEQLLQRSGLQAEVKQSQMGASVCRIGKTGCSSGNCFCKYPTFWGYWTQDPGQNKWTFANVGLSTRTVKDGSLDGWVWAKNGKPAPPKETIGSVCTASLAAQASVPAKRGGTTRGNALIGFAAAVVALALAGAIAVWRRVRATSESKTETR
jgi:hypothetical protein